MAVLTGYSGIVKLSTNTVAEIQKWSLSTGKNMADTASFGDSWEEKSPTLGKWSGSFSGSLDNTDTNGHIALRTAALNGTTVSLRLHEDATHYYSGTAYIEMALDAEVTNIVQANYTFTGTGALSYT
jgi:predicted secreted protein